MYFFQSLDWHICQYKYILTSPPPPPPPPLCLRIAGTARWVRKNPCNNLEKTNGVSAELYFEPLRSICRSRTAVLIQCTASCSAAGREMPKKDPRSWRSTAHWWNTMINSMLMYRAAFPHTHSTIPRHVREAQLNVIALSFFFSVD